METNAGPQTPVLTLEYRWLTHPQVAAGVTFAMVAIYLIYTVSNPAHEVWNPSVAIDWGNALRYIFVEVYLIELATGVVLFWLVRCYASLLRLNEMPLSPGGILTYYLKFLPLFLTAFFFINPLTQTIRYWYVHYPHWLPEVYFSEYFYSLRLYLLYLIPILLMGYIGLSLNLLVWYNRRREKDGPGTGTATLRSIKVSDAQGESFIPVDAVMWFVVEDRKYFAVTPEQKKRISQQLDQLEDVLDGATFFRVNRGAIVNLRFVKSYAYWEHDKYVLHMRDAGKTTFTLTRKRMKDLKPLLAKGVDEAEA